MSLQPITIIGGGLAGLALGIGLRQRGVPVTIWEAGQYPRHRVCGEFISGNGPAVLERLGLRALLENAGAIQAQTAQFMNGHCCSPVRTLPPALCLSRFDLDHLLAVEFQRLGGALLANQRHAGAAREGTVRASGRRAQPTDHGWRWFGLKVHARQVPLAADLEMHLSPHSYVGITRINNEEVNVCGLFRARPGQKPGGAKSEPLRGWPGTLLADRLQRAEFNEESFCSIAGLSLKPRYALERTELCIGDALTMIPPATGNGMSMAFESAEFAIDPLARFSRGEMTWSEARHCVARACDAAFARRLAWARWLQALLFSPLVRSPAAPVLLGSDRLWEMMFSRTR